MSPARETSALNTLEGRRNRKKSMDKTKISVTPQINVKSKIEWYRSHFEKGTVMCLAFSLSTGLHEKDWKSLSQYSWETKSSQSSVFQSPRGRPRWNALLNYQRAFSRIPGECVTRLPRCCNDRRLDQKGTSGQFLVIIKWMEPSFVYGGRSTVQIKCVPFMGKGWSPLRQCSAS